MSDAIDKARKRVVGAAREAVAPLPVIPFPASRGPSPKAALDVCKVREAELRAALDALDALETPLKYEAVGYMASFGSPARGPGSVEFQAHDARDDSVHVRVDSQGLLEAVRARDRVGVERRFRITITEIVEIVDD